MLEADGVVLAPDEMLNRFVNFEGNLNQVFVFSRTKESCEALAKD